MDSREVPAAAGLAVREVTVSFGGIKALEDVSVEVAGGEVVGVIGPNGAGKTTLFNVICGFVAPDSGSITWRDASLDRLRPHRLSSMGIARTLQGVGLFSKLTVLENVMTGADRFRRARYGGALLGMWTSDRDERALRERAGASLEKLDCAGIEDRLPGTLPFAVQKRVALARALACDPELLLLDEPAGGLATDEMSELGQLIRTLGKSIAVMVVEHHMDLVMSVCDRVVVLDFGRVIAAGEPSAIRENPRVLEAYLGRDASEENVAAAGTTDAGG
ncbi:MAG: ABC transporter ATP-binding protein [Solirubrobacteraceae bacterium]